MFGFASRARWLIYGFVGLLGRREKAAIYSWAEAVMGMETRFEGDGDEEDSLWY